MLLNALGGRRKPAEHRCNPYEALAQGISDQRGLFHVASATRHFSYPSNFSVSHPVSRMTKTLPAGATRSAECRISCALNLQIRPAELKRYVLVWLKGHTLKFQERSRPRTL